MESNKIIEPSENLPAVSDLSACGKLFVAYKIYLILDIYCAP